MPYLRHSDSHVIFIFYPNVTPTVFDAEVMFFRNKFLSSPKSPIIIKYAMTLWRKALFYRCIILVLFAYKKYFSEWTQVLIFEGKLNKKYIRLYPG